MLHYTITFEKTFDMTLFKVSHGVLGVCLGVSDCDGIERKGSGERRMKGVGRERRWGDIIPLHFFQTK